LLDTNVLSEPLRLRPNVGVLERLALHRAASVTAAPVWHELLFGVWRLPPSRQRRSMERYLDERLRTTVVILPYDIAAAEWHADERARLSAIGRTPPHLDGQIAAIAATNDLTLVTANAADFEHFDGLQVEDWRS
jgi:tRNA(fMet)-specific endonuclease VapC